MQRKIMLISLLLALGVVGVVIWDTMTFKVQQVYLQKANLKNHQPIHILQISDIHNKVFSQDNQPLVDRVGELAPDLIVLTGDMIDRATRDFGQMIFLAEGLCQLAPTYFVSGNHEWANPVGADFLKQLGETGVVILNNDHEKVLVDGQTIELVGIDDPSSRHEDMEKAFKGVDPSAYRVLVAHSPTVALRYPGIEADLIICGHTHGGQIRFPLIGALVTPDQGFFPTYAKGTYDLDNGTTLYVDSGLGTSLLPIRFLNRSQISSIYIGQR